MNSELLKKKKSLSLKNMLSFTVQGILSKWGWHITWSHGGFTPVWLAKIRSTVLWSFEENQTAEQPSL